VTATWSFSSNVKRYVCLPLTESFSLSATCLLLILPRRVMVTWSYTWLLLVPPCGRQVGRGGD
jgi:hypothetical protein